VRDIYPLQFYVTRAPHSVDRVQLRSSRKFLGSKAPWIDCQKLRIDHPQQTRVCVNP
jgi:hypothetical protein